MGIVMDWIVLVIVVAPMVHVIDPLLIFLLWLIGWA